jgi:hypothetical protein
MLDRTCFAWALPALVLGCTPVPAHAPAKPTASRTAARADREDPWSDCYAHFSPSGHAWRDLKALTRICGPLGGMRPLSSVVADQTERAPADRYTFYVDKPGRCYRVYAASDRGIRDLDLLIRDAGGNPVAADLTHDAWPVLPPAEPLCVPRAGMYMLEVSVFQGRGRYAVQVWGK